MFSILKKTSIFVLSMVMITILSCSKENNTTEPQEEYDLFPKKYQEQGELIVEGIKYSIKYLKENNVNTRDKDALFNASQKATEEFQKEKGIFTPIKRSISQNNEFKEKLLSNEKTVYDLIDEGNYTEAQKEILTTIIGITETTKGEQLKTDLESEIRKIKTLPKEERDLLYKDVSNIYYTITTFDNLISNGELQKLFPIQRGWWNDWGQCAAGTLGGALTGGLFGAIGGSTVPGIGTVAGGIIGAIGGGLTGAAASC